MIRRRNVQTLQEKLRIIEEVENSPNEKKFQIAKRLGIAPTTLASIWSRKKKIRAQIEKYGQLSNRKSSKESKFKDLEVILFSWYQESLADNIPVNGVTIRERAKEIAKNIGISDFTASSGWISRFKERYSIAKKHKKDQEKTNEEKYWTEGLPTMVKFNKFEISTVRTFKELPVSKALDYPGLLTDKKSDCEDSFKNDISSKWLEELPSLLEGYDFKDIYCLHETGLFYNCLPDSVAWLKDETCYEGKRSKERLSVLFCVNCDGSDKKLPVIIGKATKPRCFNNLKQLPMPYYSNAKAWFTSDILSLFFRTLDAEMGAQQRNILLFMDDCETHYTYLKNIKLIFYPSNCASLFQPLHGVTKCFKAYYRRELVKKCVSIMIQNKIKDQSVVKINILQAMHLIIAAWRQVKQSTITNWFKKCGFSCGHPSGDVTDIEDNIADFEEWKVIDVPSGVDFNSYVNVDSCLFTRGVPLSVNSWDLFEKEREIKDDQADSLEPVPTLSNACAAFKTLKTYLYSRVLSEEEKTHIACVENLLNDAINVSSCNNVII